LVLMGHKDFYQPSLKMLGCETQKKWLPFKTSTKELWRTVAGKSVLFVR
jgi:hypothetical protein